MGIFATSCSPLKNDPANPSILYLEELMTAGQLASLYTACQCFAAPYRAEDLGFRSWKRWPADLAPTVTAQGAQPTISRRRKQPP